jgi:hypothetical protein
MGWPAGHPIHRTAWERDTAAKVQGRDEITVDLPAARVWPLIADSALLPRRGPAARPVASVDPDPGT